MANSVGVSVNPSAARVLSGLATRSRASGGFSANRWEQNLQTRADGGWLAPFLIWPATDDGHT